MELWIRSQKNEKLRPLLLKVNEIEIGDYHAGMNCIVVNNLHCVGIYNSKERALEVLDEIHTAILTNKILELTVDKIPADELNTEKAGKLFKDIVYEMPKE